MRLLRVGDSRYLQQDMIEEVHTDILAGGKTMLTFYMFSGREVKVKVRSEDAAAFIAEHKIDVELRP